MSSIELDDDWEVGLTEISFPFSIENVVDRECYLKISHPEFDTYSTIPLHGGYYSEFEEVAAALHREQMNHLHHAQWPDRVLVRFSFNDNVDRVNMTIINDLNPGLARLLGFRTMVKYCVSPFLAEHKIDCPLDIHLLRFGGTRTRRRYHLRIVNRKSNEDGNMHQTFNPVMYVPLQKKCFDSVEINMMTNTRRATYKYFVT